MSNRKVMMILLTVGLVKKISLYKMCYFPDRYIRDKSKIKVELDLSNYSTKSDSKVHQVMIHRNLLRSLI